jgi:hypothetical protein
MKLRCTLLFICFVLFSLVPFRLSAQEAEPSLQAEAEQDAPPETADIPVTGTSALPPDTDLSNAVFFIRNIDFDISGPTFFGYSLLFGYSRAFAIQYHSEIKEGDEITGRDSFEKYIRDKTQLLINQRVIETARIEYTINPAEADGRYPVDLLIITRDTWNIIAVPYPKYDSNSGFSLTVKARDYNFFGTMNPLRLDIGYERDTDDEDTFNLVIDSDTRFKALGLNWNLNFDHEFYFTFGDPLSYINSTGVAVELPVEKTTLTFDVEHYINVNKSNSDKYHDNYGRYFEGVYNSVKFLASWELPTGLNLGEYGELTYTPKISEEIVYSPSTQWPLDNLHRGPMTNLSHSIGFDKVDWIGNFRKGFDMYLNNSNTLRPDESGKPVWNVNYGFTGIGHFIINDSFGISARLKFTQWFNKFPDRYSSDAADVLRGIPDKDVNADYMLSLNLDFPVRIVRFNPAQRYNKPKLHLFDFEMYFSPVFDFALVRDPVSGRGFTPADMLFSGGFELIIFPGFMRSLYLRISPCFDLIKFIDQSVVPVMGKDSDGERNLELFIGIGLHY